jgi:hypothetical protein
LPREDNLEGAEAIVPCGGRPSFVVGALREGRIPARNRVGLAGYLR